MFVNLELGSVRCPIQTNRAKPAFSDVNSCTLFDPFLTLFVLIAQRIVVCRR